MTTETLPHQRVTVRGPGNQGIVVPEHALTARTLLHGGNRILEMTYANGDRYGIGADGSIISGDGFSTPRNPFVVHHHAQQVLTNDGFVTGEARLGFGSADRQRMLDGVTRLLQAERDAGLAPPLTRC